MTREAVRFLAGPGDTRLHGACGGPAPAAPREAPSYAVGVWEPPVRVRVDRTRAVPSSGTGPGASSAEAPRDQAAAYSSAPRDSRTRRSAARCASWNGRRPISATPVSRRIRWAAPRSQAARVPSPGAATAQASVSEPSRRLRDGVGLIAYVSLVQSTWQPPRVNVYFSPEAYAVRPPRATHRVQEGWAT